MAPQVKTFVVDNASCDGTLETLRATAHITLIANAENRGFATAVNQGATQGARESDAEFFLLLNPDAILLTGVDSLVEASRQYGLSAGKLVDSDGATQRGFNIRRLPTPMALIFETLGINRLWPSNPVNRHYRCLDCALETPGFVEQPAGAFLMTRRDVFESLNGMDERFHPVWFEDVDYCKRALEAGYRIEYLPDVKARHQGGHSILRISEGCRAWYWCVSLLRYAAKHFGSAGYRGICLAVAFSSFPRMVAGMIRTRSFKPNAAYLKVVSFAGLCLFSSRGSAARGSGIS